MLFAKTSSCLLLITKVTNILHLCIIKVGYFKAAHVKINFDELFRDFLEVYKHAIPSGVRFKRVKDDSGHEPYGEGASVRKRAIKFHPYYFVLGFIFPMLRLFQEVICSIKCAPAQCSPNVVRAMVVLKLEQVL